MSDPYPSLNPTRSPLGSRPPLAADSASAASVSRTPFVDSIPELKPAQKDASPLRLPAVLLLAAACVAAGWYLLPHDAPTTTKRETETSSTAIAPSAPLIGTGEAVPTASSNLSEAVLAAYRGDPREPGLRHITTLQLAGSYAQAADFAVAAPLDYRRDFTIAAYHEWGRHQPDQAMASAIRIEEAFTRDFAMHSVLSGWARTDPEGMAEASLAFPDSDFKKAALKRALRAWMNKDPNVAGDWILSHPEAVPVAEELFRRDRRD